MGDLKRAWKITRIVSRTDPACIELGTSMGQSECGATGVSSVPGEVRQDYAEAFRWFQKGAVANDSDAQTNLGYRYDQGFGCERNLPLDLSWYRKAAEAGNPLGQNNLADMYLRGVTRHDAEAFRWFQKSAAQGHTGARIKLGYMYAEGLRTQKDPEAAYFWIVSAALAGDSRGRELLAKLKLS
jgi:uncharacterized protein